MRQFRRVLLSFLLIMTFMFSTISSSRIQAAPLLNTTNKTMTVGATTSLSLKGNAKTVVWTSSNKKIATVSSTGKVKAISPGVANITAKVGSKSYPCKVTVKKTGLTASFIDVGQGDCILIQVNGQNILIDTGEENQYSKVEKVLKDKKISTINHFIITHPDSDHMGGADKIIDKFKVEKVYLSEFTKSTNEYKELIKSLDDNKIKPIYPKSGDKLNLGAGVKATVLSPKNNKYEDSNASSIVLKLDYYENSFLFTGDIDAKVEKEIMDSYDVDVDVLKVAHHGSDYSNGILFISKTSPKYAVIMVGNDNNYGHPVSNVLNRLEKYSDKILRTDESGNIEITSDGYKLSYSSSKYEVQDEPENSLKPSPIPSAGSIIGNVNSKIYHVSSCSWLPDEENRIYFITEEKAVEEGYRACKRCYK